MSVPQKTLIEFRGTIRNMSDHSRLMVIQYLEALQDDVVDNWAGSESEGDSLELKGRMRAFRSLMTEFQAPDVAEQGIERARQRANAKSGDLGSYQ